MLRTVDVNINLSAAQTTYNFPNNSLGLLATDKVVGIAIRVDGKSKTDKALVNSDILAGGFITLKEKGGRDIHQSLALAYVYQLSQSDRFQMLPIPSCPINWEESTINFVSTLTDNTVLELIIYYKAAEDCY